MDTNNNVHRIGGSQSVASTRYFAMIDEEVLVDDRLTGSEIKLYGIIARYRQSNPRHPRHGQAWPSRATLARVSEFHPDYISRATSKLTRLGYLEKQHQGGAGNAVTYRFPLIDGRSKTGSSPDTAGAYSDRAIRVSSDDTYIALGRSETTPPDPEPEAPEAPVPDPVPQERGEEIQKPQEPKSQEQPLAYPPVPEILIPAILAALAGLGRGTKQTLMDELTGAMGTRTIINPVGYIRALRRLHDAGGLHLEHTPRVADERKRREENQRAYQRAVAMRPATPSTVASMARPESVAGHIARLRAALAGL